MLKNILATILILLSSFLIFSCGENIEKTSNGISIAGLMKNCPNLKMFEGSKISSEVVKFGDNASLPSPSGRNVMIRCRIEIDLEAAGKIKNSCEWEIVGRHTLPDVANELLPAGELYTCRSINSSFESNPLFVRGIVLSDGKDWSVLYIRVFDIDYPIDFTP